MQSKRPRFNPLILALALAAVLMVWSVLSGTGSASSSSMEYSTVVHYFESLQVTQFSLDLNTGVITMNLKEGGKNNLPLPDTTSQSTTQATGGLLSGMLSSSDEDTAAQKNSDGTVTVRYKLPYAIYVRQVCGRLHCRLRCRKPGCSHGVRLYPCQGKHPWMEILFYLAMLGCTGFLLFSMMRGGAGGGGIMNVGKAKVKDEHENQKTATFADVAGEDEEKEELKEVVEFLKSPEKFNTLGARIPTACCWWALRAPARPCWPAPAQARPVCPSIPFPALTLWKCTSAWVHPACVTCSIRPKRPCPASSSLMRSMLWAVSAVPVWAAATMNASRP